jgi:hypothetical protein
MNYVLVFTLVHLRACFKSVTRARRDQMTRQPMECPPLLLWADHFLLLTILSLHASPMEVLLTAALARTSRLLISDARDQFLRSY